MAHFNPMERLHPLAKAKIPIFHVHGDEDSHVPMVSHSGELYNRYSAMGGQMTLRVVNGQGHNMWGGFFQSQEIVDFVASYALEK